MESTLTAEGAILIVLGVLFYFLPTGIAAARKHQQANAILILNLFLGWTALGWLASLVWAFTAVKKPQEIGATKTCPYCAETIKEDAVVCRFCGKDLAEQAKTIPATGAGQ